MRDSSLRGIYPAFVTPLIGKDTIAFNVAEKLLTRLLDSGADGVYVCGSTGEGPLLSLPMREELVDCLMKSLPSGRRLIVHVGAGGIGEALRLADHAARRGAHAISSLPPRGNFGEVRDYYKQLAENSSLPLILYYFPDVIPGALERPEELKEICALPNVSAVKFTDYNLYLLAQLSEAGTLVFNGRDEVLAAGLLMGAQGGIGSTYNLIPELYVAMYRHSLRGEWEQAAQLQRRANQIIGVLLKYPFIPALKCALARAGFDCGPALNGLHFKSSAQREEFLAEIAQVLPER